MYTALQDVIDLWQVKFHPSCNEDFTAGSQMLLFSQIKIINTCLLLKWLLVFPQWITVSSKIKINYDSFEWMEEM